MRWGKIGLDGCPPIGLDGPWETELKTASTCYVVHGRKISFRCDVCFSLSPCKYGKESLKTIIQGFSNVALKALKPNEKTSKVSLNSNDKKIRVILMLEIRAHPGNYVTAFQSLNHNQHDATGK